MAAAPSKGLKFEIDGLKFAFGIVDGADFGDILVLAKEKHQGANDYSWISQSQLNELTYKGEPTNAEIQAWCAEALAQANRVLAKDFPVGGVTNPTTPKEKVEVWVMGLMFDNTTNQIRVK